MASVRTLPDGRGSAAWQHLVLPDGLVDRLRHHATFALRHRGVLDGTRSALHGLLVLAGPPGTGKTTAARAVADTVADDLAAEGRTTFVELDPHSLPSDLLGESQRNATSLLDRVLPELAGRERFTIVLIDEVEAFATSRSAASMTSNPIDVHRTTDAILSGIDRLAREHPRTLFLATTNFPEAVDAAFLSRADAVLRFPLPDRDAAEQIVRDTLEGLAVRWPALAELAADRDLHAEVAQRPGLDARELRKRVLAAFTTRPELSKDPSLLTAEDVRAAFRD